VARVVRQRLTHSRLLIRTDEGATRPGFDEDKVMNARYSNEADSYVCPKCGTDVLVWALHSDSCHCPQCGWEGKLDRKSPPMDVDKFPNPVLRDE
jgi:ribosomal protein S27AE